jgi:hypothetical protein
MLRRKTLKDSVKDNDIDTINLSLLF